MEFTKELWRCLTYILCLCIGFVVLICAYLIVLDWPLFKIAYFHKIIAEMMLVLAFALLLYSKRFLIRLFSYLTVLIYFIVNYFQIVSLAFSGDFVPSVALENLQHTNFLVDPARVAWLLIIVLALAGCYLSAARYTSPTTSFKPRLLIVVLLLITGAFIKNDSRWLSNQDLKDRFEFYDSGRASIEYKAPGSAMIDSIQEFYQFTLRNNWILRASVELSKASAEFAYEFGFRLNELSTDYPLLRSLKFKEPPAFIPEKKWKPKNLIVFFVEGLSSRVIQPYSENFPAISPNIETLSKKSLVVENYYSHSFATYRALAGQFCSLYVSHRLSDKNEYRCLPHVLKEKGYQSQFFVSQSLAQTDLDDVATKAGFDEVFGFEALNKLVPNYEPIGRTGTILSDNSFIRGFNKWLIDNEGNDDKPFFAALYNFETHAGVHLTNGLEYRDQIGGAKSIVLDRFHNFDVVFKQFLDYFESSPYRDNTVVVVTSDHGTYPSKAYAKLILDKSDFSKLFVDKIPLIIYHPDGEPGRFDAANASSINLAPSLLHILNLEDKAVPFTGRTIFDQETKFPKPLAATYGITFTKSWQQNWLKQTRGLEVKMPVGENKDKPFHELVLYLQDLENQNRLTPAKD